MTTCIKSFSSTVSLTEVIFKKAENKENLSIRHLARKGVCERRARQGVTVESINYAEAKPLRKMFQTSSTEKGL